MLDRANNFRCFSPPLSQRKQLVARWGNFTLAWSIAVQDGLSYFGDDSGVIAYARKWGYVHVLGDPVCSPASRENLVEHFVDAYPNAAFYQISGPTARILESRGFYVNDMGVDSRIELKSYDFNGKKKEHLRYASNWLAKRGFRVEEVHDESVSREAANEITKRWRRTRIVKSREVAFLNRPLEENEWMGENSGGPRVRRFFLRSADNEMLAFVFFDPLIEDGQVVGYVTSFKRRSETAPPIAEVGITKHAIELFKSEGLRCLHLGLSPLAEIENTTFRKNWFLHHSFQYVFRSKLFNRYVYNLTGHAEFKKRFRGESEKVHFASPKIVNDLRFASFLRLCRAI